MNCGCPLELINEKGGGCTLASRSNKLEEVMKAMSAVMGGLPLTLKLRTGLKVYQFYIFISLLYKQFFLLILYKE